MSAFPFDSLARRINRFSEQTGRVVSWLALVMVLVGAANAIVRYLDRFTGLGLSSNTFIELQWYMFAGLFLLSAAYTLKHDAHVRVDVLYGRLGLRGRAWIDLVGTLLFLIPFCVLMLVVSWPYVMDSWSRFEVSPDPGGLPRYPIKTLIPLAFALLMIQAVAMLIRQVALIRGSAAEVSEPREAGEGV